MLADVLAHMRAPQESQLRILSELAQQRILQRQQEAEARAQHEGQCLVAGRTLLAQAKGEQQAPPSYPGVFHPGRAR